MMSATSDKRKNSVAKLRAARHYRAIALGMNLRQNGDSEGCLAFDPANREHVKLAIKIAGVRPKRQVTPEQVGKMRLGLQKAQQEGVLAC
jgi:hypothetical protein